MEKLLFVAALAIGLAVTPPKAHAQAAVDAKSAVEAKAAVAQAKIEPSDHQRIIDLEAYINNTLRGADAAGATVASKVSGSGPGHNGFQMVCAALVLFMTLPGLFIFYGGLVRKKNVLSVVAQCFAIVGLVTILWFTYGYSFVFADGAGPILGNLKFAFFQGVDSMPNANYSYWVSQNVFSMYQLMFAIITPAVILGSIAERMKFTAVMVFVTLWMVIVYFPITHMVWGINGLMNGVWNPDAAVKAIDFAGGYVVEISSGWSGLVLCLILGKRLGYGKEPMQPHSMTLCAIGAGMLWVGWYGFNAGSAVAADGIAANAFTTTTIAAAVASFVWAMAEYVVRGKPSILGFCSGAVAGLVTITPACGFVTPAGSFIIGILAGIVPFLACWKLKAIFQYDDALDAFGVHAVGGTMGVILTGMLTRHSVNSNLALNLKAYVTDTLFQPLLVEQIKAMGITIALNVIGTAVIAFGIKAVIGLRTDEEVETIGLDLAEHGEEGYHG